MNAFESDEQDRIITIRDRFDKICPDIWKGIGFSNATETFGEVSDQPVTKDDLALLETGLRELRKLNEEFLSIAATRAEALIKHELGLRVPRRPRSATQR